MEGVVDDEPLLVPCPTCRMDEVHEILKATEQTVTVRCTECQTIRSMSPPRDRTVELQLIISEGEESRPDRIETPSEEPIRVGDEFEHAGHRMLVTALEAADHRRVQDGPAHDLHTVFAKVFDTVTLKIAVNEGDITRSHEIQVDPDREVHIGEVLDLDSLRVAVKTLKSDQNRTLHKGFLRARNVRRAFCDPVKGRARPGERVRTRTRGRPAESRPPKRPPRHGR